MLSWQSGICFVMDPDELEVHTVFKYKGYGWGLAHNNTHLIMSDGSDTLTFRDPTSFEIVRSIKVTEKVAEGYSARYTRVPVKNLNELEYIPLTGLVYANVWFKDSIAAIDPATGYVVQWISVIAEETKEDLGKSTKFSNTRSGICTHVF